MLIRFVLSVFRVCLNLIICKSIWRADTFVISIESGARARFAAPIFAANDCAEKTRRVLYNLSL